MREAYRGTRCQSDSGRCGGHLSGWDSSELWGEVALGQSWSQPGNAGGFGESPRWDCAATTPSLRSGNLLTKHTVGGLSSRWSRYSKGVLNACTIDSGILTDMQYNYSTVQFRFWQAEVLWRGLQHDLAVVASWQRGKPSQRPRQLENQPACHAASKQARQPASNPTSYQFSNPVVNQSPQPHFTPLPAQPASFRLPAPTCSSAWSDHPPGTTSGTKTCTFCRSVGPSLASCRDATRRLTLCPPSPSTPAGSHQGAGLSGEEKNTRSL